MRLLKFATSLRPRLQLRRVVVGCRQVLPIRSRVKSRSATDAVPCDVMLPPPGPTVGCLAGAKRANHDTAVSVSLLSPCEVGAFGQNAPSHSLSPSSPLFPQTLVDSVTGSNNTSNDLIGRHHISYTTNIWTHHRLLPVSQRRSQSQSSQTPGSSTTRQQGNIGPFFLVHTTGSSHSHVCCWYAAPVLSRRLTVNCRQSTPSIRHTSLLSSFLILLFPPPVVFLHSFLLNLCALILATARLIVRPEWDTLHSLHTLVKEPPLYYVDGSTTHEAIPATCITP